MNRNTEFVRKKYWRKKYWTHSYESLIDYPGIIVDYVNCELTDRFIIHEILTCSCKKAISFLRFDIGKGGTLTYRRSQDPILDGLNIILNYQDEDVNDLLNGVDLCTEVKYTSSTYKSLKCTENHSEVLDKITQIYQLVINKPYYNPLVNLKLEISPETTIVNPVRSVDILKIADIIEKRDHSIELSAFEYSPSHIITLDKKSGSSLKEVMIGATTKEELEYLADQLNLK